MRKTTRSPLQWKPYRIATTGEQYEMWDKVPPRQYEAPMHQSIISVMMAGIETTGHGHGPTVGGDMRDFGNPALQRMWKQNCSMALKTCCHIKGRLSLGMRIWTRCVWNNTKSFPSTNKNSRYNLLLSNITKCFMSWMCTRWHLTCEKWPTRGGRMSRLMKREPTKQWDLGNPCLTQ